MKQILFILSIIFTAHSMNAQGGLFYQAAGGAIISNNKPTGVISAAVGYHSGTSAVYLYSHVGAGFVQLGSLEYQQSFFKSSKLRPFLLSGFSAFSSYMKAENSVVMARSSSTFAFNTGVGAKYYLREKLAVFISFRASSFKAMRYQASEQSIVSPFILSVGMSK